MISWLMKAVDQYGVIFSLQIMAVPSNYQQLMIISEEPSLGTQHVHKDQHIMLVAAASSQV